MPSIYYPNSKNNKNEDTKRDLNRILPFMELRTYDVHENSKEGFGYGLFKIRPNILRFIRENLYNPELISDTISPAQEDYLKKLKEHITKLENHRKAVDEVVYEIIKCLNALDESVDSHAMLIDAFKEAFNVDSIDDSIDDESALNHLSNTAMEKLNEALFIGARLTGSYENKLSTMIDKLTPENLNGRNTLSTTANEFKEEWDIITKNLAILLNYYNQVTHNPSPDGYDDAVKPAEFNYFNLNEIVYKRDLPNRNTIDFSKMNVDLNQVTPSTDEITLLNTMHGVIVRFILVEQKIEVNESRKNFKVEYIKTSSPHFEGGNTMPSGMFMNSEANVLRFVGSVTHGTTILGYEKSQRNLITGPNEKLYGIDRFQFIGELANVNFLLNIREVIGNQNVVAEMYNGSRNSLPDTSPVRVTGNTCVGSMRKYLEHSTKIIPRTRGKLYCIFYINGHIPVAADEKNIYSINTADYRSMTKTNNFRSGKDNSYHLPDAYTLNALDYARCISQIDLARKYTGEKSSQALHTAHTFLTVSVVRPVDLGYKTDYPLNAETEKDPPPSYNIKIIKSNIVPNFRLKKVVAHSEQYIKKEDDDMVVVCDDPLWPCYFATDRSQLRNTHRDREEKKDIYRKRADPVIEVFDLSRMSCTAYCNNNEYNLEILIGDSLHVDNIISRGKELMNKGRLSWNGYDTNLDSNQIKNFLEYVSTNYGKYLYSRMSHSVPLPRVSDKMFLIMQKKREILYAVYRSIVQNRENPKSTCDFNTVISRYVPNNNYIPFYRVKIEESEPTMNKMRVMHVTASSEGSKKTFSFNLSVNGKATKVDGARPVWKIRGSPESTGVGENMKFRISRKINLTPEQQQSYSRIIGNMIVSADRHKAMWFVDTKTPAELDFSGVVVPDVIRNNVALHLLKNGKHTIDNQNEYIEGFNAMLKSYRNSPQSKQAGAKRSVNTVDRIMFAELNTDKYLKTTLQDRHISIYDELSDKTYLIDRYYEIEEEIIRTASVRLDDRYQYSFGWIDAPFVSLFLERIDAKKLEFVFYQCVNNKDYELKDLATAIHKVCEEPIRASSYDEIIKVLSLKKQGLEIQHEHTILHTIVIDGFTTFYDNPPEISFIKPIAPTPAVADVKQEESNAADEDDIYDF